jgi:3-oxoacyl-[acyl-carrier protein] reductase
MKLQNKVAIITGAAQGIGRQYALRFAREGAAVMLVDLREQQVQDVAREIVGAGGKAAAVKADVTSEQQMAELAKRTAAEMGRIDAIINNAATYHDYNFADESLEYGRKIMEVNLYSIIVTSRAVFPYMKAQRSGSIINISSTASYPFQIPSDLDLQSVPVSFYGLAKSGVIYLTKTMARSLGRYNIRVNAIAPGVTRSEATLKVVPESIVGLIRSQTALGRELDPSELAGAAVFLASEDSAPMTGQTLVVDAGHNMLG